MTRRVSIVLAEWCPHCVPFSLENAKRMAKELNTEFRVLDIDDPEQERIADELVKDYGDYSVDYLIPQVFVEEEWKSSACFYGILGGRRGDKGTMGRPLCKPVLQGKTEKS